MSTQISSAPNGAAQPTKHGRSIMLRILGAAVLAGAIGFGAWYVLASRWYEGTDDAYVNGNVVQITPQIVGTVVSIGADDGDFVKQGDVLVTLDKADADVALENAAANLANTVRKVRGLYSTVSGAQADVAVRQTAVQKAKDDYDRRANLASSGAISAEELSHAKDALTAAESSLTTAEQQLQTNKVLVDDTIVTSHPDVKAAASQYRAAYLTEVRTTMVAPVTGYVAKRSVQVGQRVQPGAALMAVVPLHEVWIDANFKETQLMHMRIGQPVEVTSDIYGHAVKYDGKVLELGVGTGGAFSLLPAQNATGNWIKIVQRMPVRVVFTDPKQLDQHPLRVGMSLTTRVDLHDKSGPMLAQKVPTRPAFSTDVYEQQLAHADEQVAQLIHKNMAGDAK
ncbi:efflux RND transporter periplasmic adaptor subunit [Dyella humicola]|uniref:efflux RND transporter periplasmic adaptor subunit n=1 Tax=Dyella humicola TaxID=2992126 RepID=UPI00225AF11F|nr:efflux RND transporter periplasmic adaptor subunit [Dyella humicola]